MIQFKINGQTSNAPVEWQDLEVQVDFTEQQEASITTDEFTFPLQASEIITSHVRGGLTGLSVGIFEGISLDITVFEQNQTANIFNGFLDFNNFKVLDPCRVQSKIIKTNSFNNYYELMQSNTFGKLRADGVISSGDYVRIPYIVQKEFDFLEVALLSLATYMALKETIEAIKRTAESVRDIVRIASATPFSGGELAGAILNAIINLAYTTALIIYLKNLITELMAYLYPTIKHKRGMKLKRMLEIATANVGFTLDCNITDLDRLYYYPSHSTVRPNKLFGVTIADDEGIPQTADYGYRCSEILDLIIKLFNCRVKIKDNQVIIKTESDPYWFQTSTYQLPDVLSETYRYNTEDLIANRLIQFQVDTQDSYTLSNFKGTNYEVITSPINVVDKKKVLIKGLEQISFDIALGNRKNGLSAVETAIKALASIIDVLVGTNFASQVQNRIGLLKIGSDIVNVPKLLPLNASLKLDGNYRDTFNAKWLYDKYHSYKSFVLNNLHYQQQVFEDIEVPFCLHDFNSVVDNNYFTTFAGDQGYIKNIRWRLGSDKATMTYTIFKPYTKNLKETYVEPE